MGCENCIKLLALYQRSVEIYRETIDKMSGTVGDDFNKALERARQALLSSEDAGDAITMHQISAHGLEPAMARFHHASKAAHSG